MIMAAIKGMLRYGKGGRFTPEHKTRGPALIGGRMVGDGISNYKADRGSTYGAMQSQFRIDWDAENFKRALDRVGIDGDRFVKDILLEACRHAVSKARDALKDMASMQGDASEKDNIYNRVGNALRVDEVEGATFIRIHTGDTPKDAHHGQWSKSRPLGWLSSLVATGTDSFLYDKLPFAVKSSREFKKRTGREYYKTTGMLNKQYHPGLPKYDYMLHIEDEVMNGFMEDIEYHMRAMGERYGFSTSLGYKEGL